MNDVPQPGAAPDDVDWLYENYQADYVLAEWNTALEWARKGDFIPLAECFERSDLPLTSQDVRDWLASGLRAGRFLKPRKVTKRPEQVLFEDAFGRSFYLDKRYLHIFEAMKQVDRLVSEIGEDAAIDRAAAKFGLASETLREHRRRPRSHWGLRPKRFDGMFDDVIQKLASEQQPRSDS